MAITKTTQLANRYGMDITFWASGTTVFEDTLQPTYTGDTTGATINVTTFKAKVAQTAGTTSTYTFTYVLESAEWQLSSAAVTLAEYGITALTGTAANGDTIAVELTVAPDSLSVVDFANITNISLEGDFVSATGGRAKRAKIDFENPLAGTLTIGTQLITAELLTLLAGKDLATATTTINFETLSSAIRKDYVITANTVWKDEAGNVYSEKMIVWKAKPQRSLQREHTGDGDPTSVDIVFDIEENAEGKCLTITLEE